MLSSLTTIFTWYTVLSMFCLCCSSLDHFGFTSSSLISISVLSVNWFIADNLYWPFQAICSSTHLLDITNSIKICIFMVFWCCWKTYFLPSPFIVRSYFQITSITFLTFCVPSFCAWSVELIFLILHLFPHGDQQKNSLPWCIVIVSTPLLYTSDTFELPKPQTQFYIIISLWLHIILRTKELDLSMSSQKDQEIEIIRSVRRWHFSQSGPRFLFGTGRNGEGFVWEQTMRSDAILFLYFSANAVDASSHTKGRGACVKITLWKTDLEKER